MPLFSLPCKCFQEVSPACPITTSASNPRPQVLYTLRFALKGRVQPATQHRIFVGATVAALAHAGYVLSGDSAA